MWDAETGRLAKSLFAGPGQHVAFSPNGHWLAASGDSIRVWEVGSWQAGQRFAGVRVPVAFSTDSKILAFETGYGVVRLVDPATGREYGQLEDPNQEHPCSSSVPTARSSWPLATGHRFASGTCVRSASSWRCSVLTGTYRLTSLPRIPSRVYPCK